MAEFPFHIHTFHIDTYFIQIKNNHQYRKILATQHLLAHPLYTQLGVLLIYYPSLLNTGLLHFTTS